MGRNWFCNRAVDEWNGLSSYIGSVEAMGSFKRRLDKFMGEENRWN